MWKIVRKNKTYSRRYLKIYYDGKLINTVFPYGGWYANTIIIVDELTRMCCRIKILENLYWLIGGGCDYDEWQKHIEYLDNGKGVSGKSANNKTSQFFNDTEKLTALESFNNS